MRKVIAKRLSALLEEKDISERQLSLQLGYSPSYVNKIVNGQINITLDILEELCNALNVTAEEFLMVPEADTANKYMLLRDIEDLTVEDMEQLRSIIQYMKKKNMQIKKKR